MARIPDDEIQRIKSDVSLEQLARSQGVELHRRGADLVGLCPWHVDKGPSLVISPAKNLWHCLGACQQGGSVIDWVMKSNAVSFRHAVEILRADVPLTPAVKKALPSPVVATAEDRELLSQVVGYYHETLKQSPEALDYLTQRGIKSPELVEHFQLGFANRTLGYRLRGRKARERLQKLGVIRESGHEHFNGSLVIPIFGDSGEVLGMYGRKIGPDWSLRKGTPLHLYLPGPHRGVFNVDALKESKTIILCEALIDALTFWCAGHRNVTASYGVEGFTADHLAAFKQHGTERVLIAYDRDDAGEKASAALAEKLMAEGIECFGITFPRGMDANEYALKVTPADKSLGVLVRNAAWLGRGPSEKALPADRKLFSWRRRTTAAPDDASDSVADSPSRAPAPVSSLSLAAIAAKEKTESGAVSTAVPHPMIEASREEQECTTVPEVAPAEASAPAPASEPNGDEITLSFDDRRYRVRGLSKNLSFDLLKVNLLAVRGDSTRGEAMHVDTLDLYSARQRMSFVKLAAVELGLSDDVVKRDVGRVLLKLEELQHEQIRKALEPKANEHVMTEEEQAQALTLLRDPNLLDRILSDFALCGVVGEETNKLVGYLAAISRKLDEPLAVIIQSSSSAGKSSLMEAVLAMTPEEDRVKYSAMTGQSLFYMGESDLKNKILAIVEEAGAERATYALKLLQSEGELMIASTGKDPATGRLVTQEYRVEGPVMIFLTTTAVEVDEELLNRCIVLCVDEDRAQTRAIHRLQRERQTLEGLLARASRPAVQKAHQNAQRLIKPMLVVNPYARHLTFLDDRTRTRRDHVKYLTLMRTIALLHQYQRPLKTVEHRGALVPYVEVTLEDIAVANKLAHQVLGRSLDELAPQTRRLLMLLDQMVTDGCKRDGVPRPRFLFSRRSVREHTGWSSTAVHIHLQRLVELEYVLVHRGGRGQSFVYELLYEGQGRDGTPFLAGLIDVEALRAQATTVTIPVLEAGIQGQFSPNSGGVRGVSDSLSPAPGFAESQFAGDSEKKRTSGDVSQAVVARV